MNVRQFTVLWSASALGLASVAFAAEPTPNVVPASKTRVIQALQSTAEALRSRSIEPQEQPRFKELLDAADALAKDEKVPLSERERWRGMARVRLAEGADVLRRQLAKKPQLPASKASPILAQQAGAGFGAAPAATVGPSPDVGEAQKLIELITGAVRPESWEDRGGDGVIRYWSLGHALIIRNTADIQEKIGGNVGMLRP
jgi:hypothetical protein